MSDRHSSDNPGNSAAHEQRGNHSGAASRIEAIVGWSILRPAARAFARMFASEPPRIPPSLADAQPSPERGRDADQDLDPRREMPSHQRWGTFLVGCVFAASIAAAVGFLFIYWTNGNNMLLGTTLAICFGALGVALVSYARWLTPHKQAIEPREEMPSTEEEQEAFAVDFSKSAQEIPRRSLLKWMAGATVGVMAAMFISVMRSLGAPPVPSLFDRIWKRGQRLVTMDGTPVSLNALEPRKLPDCLSRGQHR